MFVEPDALAVIAGQIDRAAVAAQAASDTFAAGPAVAAVGTKMLPDNKAQEDYAQAVTGTKNQLAEIVGSLQQWAQAWRDTETFYRNADASAAQQVNNGTGTVTS